MKSWIYLFIAAIVAVVLLVILLLRCIKTKEGFENKAFVRILSPQETREFLLKDADGYVAQLSSLDLYARGVSSSSEYLERITSSVVDMDARHKTNINELAHVVDTHLMQTGQHKLASVPWKIAVVSGNVYENGYPHTRQDVIFLSTNELNSISLGRTLLHEKVHVYQRMHPEDMQRYLSDNQFKPWKMRKDEPMARANPDLDNWIYIDPQTNKPMVAYYTSSKPSSISDVVLEHPSYEHPYEKMAYDIAGHFK